jgi:F-type H+-transporting ATPase subunit a
LQVLAAGNQADIFNQVLEHLSPHKYGWAPDWGIFTFTNAVLNIILASALVIIVFSIAARRRALVPKGVQNLVEVAMDWVKDNLVYSVMSPDDGRTWGPFIATIFFFILFMNAIGLIPLIGFTPTSNIYLTAALAFMVYLLAVVLGMVKHGPLKFWKKTLVPDGVPAWLLPLMVLLIEPISQIARPFSLAVRLFANMLADHLLLLIFAGFIFISGGVLTFIVLPFSVAFMVVFTAFALFVAFIQAVVFAYLSAIYINDALHPGH